MFKKLNIKWLAAIFVVLLLLVLFASPRKNTKNQRSFNRELVNIDTTKVTTIQIKAKGKSDVVTLTRENQTWKVSGNGQTYNANVQQVEYMLGELQKLEAKRLAANDKSRWDEFEVTDSSAIRVTVKEGKKITADLYIGKFNYQQPKNPNPYMQQQGTMSTYVRAAGEKEVFVVDGFLAMSFGREVNDLRDNRLSALQTESLSKISFNTPDGNYTLNKQGSSWTVDGIMTDSLAVVQYLQSLANLSSRNFIAPDIHVSSSPIYSVSVEGENMASPFTIEAFEVADTNDMFAISSDLNKGSYFSGKKAGLLDKIFKPEKYFTKADLQQ